MLDNAEQARAGAAHRSRTHRPTLTKAIEQLGYAQLKVDFAGVVTAMGADVGQVVSPGKHGDGREADSRRPSSISARISRFRSK